MNGTDPLLLILDLDGNGVKKFSKGKISSGSGHVDNFI